MRQRRLKEMDMRFYSFKDHQQHGQPAPRQYEPKRNDKITVAMGKLNTTCSYRGSLVPMGSTTVDDSFESGCETFVAGQGVTFVAIQ
jgi:hypothetical protein